MSSSVDNNPPVDQVNVGEVGDVESLAEQTYMSSKAPTNWYEMLDNMFPIDTTRFGSFAKDSKIFTLLSETLKLDVTFITQMEAVGYVTPAIIVNRFGLSAKAIAESFALMGLFRSTNASANHELSYVC